MKFHVVLLKICDEFKSHSTSRCTAVSNAMGIITTIVILILFEELSTLACILLIIRKNIVTVWLSESVQSVILMMTFPLHHQHFPIDDYSKGCCQFFNLLLSTKDQSRSIIISSISKICDRNIGRQKNP